MKKSILNLGKTLNKAEQLTINGGSFPCYCNGKYMGNASSVGQCWFMCEPV